MGGIYWLASYPKSGNTWFRTFLRNLQEDGDEPVDINDLSTGAIASGRGWLDEVLGFDTAELSPDEVERLRPAVYRWALHEEGVGYHKIHDAYTHTSDGEPLVSREATLGALYILRNPLDVAPSAANHWHCSIDQAIERMGRSDMALARTKKALPDQVRQRLLSWSEHVLSWADARGLNCRVIRYEDMLADPVTTFSEAARFLKLPDDPARVEKAVRFSDFKELARQEAEKGFRERPLHTESFFRQGKSGGWRDKLTVAQVERIIADHGAVMRRFGYLDADGRPVAPNSEPQARTKPVQGNVEEGGISEASVQNIETSRFIVRPMTSSDVNDEYIEWWNDPALQAGLNHRPRGWDRLEAENHVRSFDNRTRFHLGIYRKNGPLVGFMAILPHREGYVANLNMVVGNKAYWGKRVPDEVLPAVFDHFFARMRVHKFKCEVPAFNRSSLAVMKRLGFTPEGVLREEKESYDGVRTDLHVFGLLKTNWAKRAVDANNQTSSRENHETE